MTTMPAAFLDRDGTIIVEHNYLRDPDLVVLETGAVEGLRYLANAGYLLIVLTNQSGIARGYFGAEQAEMVNERVRQLLSAEGVELSAIFTCPHAPGDGCDCRKPRPGLALAAAAEFNLDLKRSLMIGDKQSDLQLAEAIGATAILVTSGYGRASVEWARENNVDVIPNLSHIRRVLNPDGD